MPRIDQLQRHLNALKLEDHAQAAVLSLGAYVEAERRDLDNDAFANLDKEVQARVTTLAQRYALSVGIYALIDRVIALPVFVVVSSNLVSFLQQ